MSQTRRAKLVSRYDWALVAAILALAPMLYVHSQNLWARQHFQFFPIAWGVFVWLVWREEWQNASSKVRRWVGVLGFLLGITCLAGAIAIFSPWLAHVALVCFLLGWSLLRLGKRTWFTAVMWCGLVLATVPLPGNSDEQLIQRLQAISTSSASNLLDTFQVPHLATGNILNVRGEELFVDEACSGVGSLYALTAVALMLISLREVHPFSYSAIVLLSVPCWAWLGNVLRLTTISVVLDRYGIDLTHGWMHTLLGLVVFAGSFLCLLGFAKLVEGLLKPLGKAAEDTALNKAYKAVTRWPKVSKRDQTVGPEPNAAAGYGLVGAVGLLGCLSIMPILSLGPWQNSQWQIKTYTDVQVADNFKEECIPDSLAGFQRKSFAIERRRRGSILGEHSTTWTMKRGTADGPRLECMLSLDFPFDEFHMLETCYTGTGNSIVSLGEVATGVNEVDFQTPIGGHAYLCFMEFKADGTLVPRVSASGMFQRGLVGLPTVYQLQVFCESVEPFSQADKQALQDLLQASFSTLRPFIERVHATAN